MKPETVHNQLRAILTHLYPTPPDLARVTQDAGVPLERVPLGNGILNDWDGVLREAAKTQGVASLLDVAKRDYAENQALAIVVAAFAEFNRTMQVTTLPIGNTHLLNFARAFTEQQQQGLELSLGHRLGKIVARPIEFDHTRPYGPQCVKLVKGIKFTSAEWETLPIVVNPPGFAPGALALFSELHGRMGHFPAVVRLRQIAGSTPPAYEFAEIINLQALRDAARERGKRRS